MTQISDAINHANETVALVHVAPKQWAVKEYCPNRHTWIEGPNMPYHKALMCYAEARHSAALVCMGWDDWDATCAAASGKGRLRVRLANSLSDD